MIIEDISKAFETRLRAFGGRIFVQGEIIVPNANQAYVSGLMATRQSQQIGIGPNTPRFWSGTYRIIAAHPRADGVSAAEATADLLLRHFPRGLTLTHGVAVVVIEQGTAEASYSVVDWVNVPILIRWFCEEPSS